MTPPWAGRYQAAPAAPAENVVIAIAPHGIQLTRFNGTALWWPFEDIHLRSRDPVRFEKAAGETLAVDDAAFLAAIHAANPRVRFSAKASPERNIALVLAGFVVGVLLLAWAAIAWGVPAFAGFLAGFVPVAVEEAIGRAVLDDLAPPARRCREPALEAIVAVLAAAEPTVYRFRIRVAEDPAVNAFAAPGGYMVVFRGLLERTERPEEVAAVIAHEMRHVVERHGTRSIFRGLSLWALVSLVLGDTSGVLVNMTGALGELHFRRADEDAADRAALAMFAKARLDPRAFVRMYERLAAESGHEPRLARYLSTHPLPADRVAALRRAAEGMRYAPRPLLPGRAWPPSKASCTVETPEGGRFSPKA
jgi:Zn-dependent protease with chaperone function